MAEGSGTRAGVIFVVGFVLGAMCGGAGVGAFLGGQDEVAVAPPPPPPVPVTPAVVAPEPEPEPAPAAAPDPAPVAAPRPTPRKASPAPAPAPAPALAPKPTVTTTRGPTDIVFVGADGKRHTADAVPPGTFEVHANWGEGSKKSGTVTVQEGKAVKLVCDPPTQTCRAK